MFMLGKLDKLGMAMPLGRELSRAGMVGNLGRVPGMSAWMMEGNAAADGDEEEEEEEEVE